MTRNFRYSSWVIQAIVVLWFLLTSGWHVQLGKATTFYPAGDPWNPDPHAACLGRDLTDRDVVVAHRKLPCRSWVFLYNLRTRRGTWARVGDRGPRRAMVDLAPAAARAIRANGDELVLMVHP